MNFKLMTLLIIIVLFSNCVKKKHHIPFDDNPPEINKDTVFELIWETKFKESTIGSDIHQIWKDYFLVSGDTDKPIKITAYNKKTGKIEWEYNNTTSLKYGIWYSGLIGDIYIGKTGDGVFGYDLTQRQIIWQINFKEKKLSDGWKMTIHGDYIYMPVTWMFGLVNVSDERMIRIDYRTGDMETVYHIKSVDSLMDAFSAPVFWTDPETGHDIMYFNNQNWNYSLSPQEISQDMIAVDIETGEVRWCNCEFTPVASNGLIHPIIYKDNVITGGDWSMYSFDAKTGKQNWKTEFSNLKPWPIWSTAEHLVVENRLYCKDNGQSIWCLNADTGEVIWHNPTDGSNCTPSTVYYKDMLVYTSWGKGSIMVLDAFTGKRIHRERSHNGSTFNTDVVYDKETDMFFTTDYKYAYGFKIHKPE